MTESNDKRWFTATLVKSEKTASNVMKLVFDVKDWPGHKAGQHVDVRLTAPDGYMAERSYSIANAPGEGTIVELGVELMENGEVSPYLWTLKPGEQIELRGPIGGHFIWDASDNMPLVLIAGGSGMVPLMSMLRHHLRHDAEKERDIIFLISLRTIDRLLYSEEIAALQNSKNIKVIITLTESAPQDWNGYARRIDAPMFEKEFGYIAGEMPMIYVCGPTKFVEAAAKLLLDMKINTHLIKTERFGG